MTKPLQIFILFFSGLSSANQIDDLKTTEDVVNFVKIVDSDFANEMFDKFTIKSTDSIVNYLECKSIFNKWNIQNWEKSDLNNDGKTDLVFFSYWSSFDLYAIIDLGNGNYKLFPLSNDSFEDCELAKPIKIKDKNYLKFYKRKQIAVRENGKFKHYENVIQIDTLAFLKTGIFEKNNNVEKYDIESVEIETSYCYGFCPVFALKVYMDGRAEFNGVANTDKKGKSTTKYSKAIINNIVEMLEYSSLKELNKIYEVTWTDDQTVVLTVKFKDGTSKVIQDYGLQGTFGLNSIYKYLISLGKETKWE